MNKESLIQEFKCLGLKMSNKVDNFYDVRKDDYIIYSFSNMQEGMRALKEEKRVQKNLIKITLTNMNEIDKIHYLDFLELEENKIYDVIKHDRDFYKLAYGNKKGLWISKKICSICTE